MTVKQTLAEAVGPALLAPSADRIDRRVLAPYDGAPRRANELCFFLKPEVTSLKADGLRAVLGLVDESFARFHVEWTGAAVLGASYLAAHGIIAQHYGVINKVARLGRQALSSAALDVFRREFNEDADKVDLIGAFQCLERFDFLNPASLNVLWDNAKTRKLGGGTYCANLNLLGKRVFLLNGFHPYQISHFTKPGSTIVVLSVQSDTAWKSLRDDMLGATNPTAAAAGSLRRTLLDRASSIGLAEVSAGYNCAHLSAGPLEALVELRRFFSDYERGAEVPLQGTATGRSLVAKGVQPQLLEALLANPVLPWNGAQTTPFDLTEVMDAAAVADFLLRNSQALDASLAGR